MSLRLVHRTPPVSARSEPRLLVTPSPGISTGFLLATAILLGMAGLAFFLIIRV
ncbi:MAG: hypothetical protein ACREAA_15760 [Candidatus Polarisedimenticolia bacterium]